MHKTRICQLRSASARSGMYENEVGLKLQFRCVIF